MPGPNRSRRCALPARRPRPGAAEPLAAYRALERHCARILQAARDDDWDRVERLRRRSLQMIARLREQAAAPLESEQRREKFRLLREIARIDAEVRHLAQPWTRTIDQMFPARAAAATRPDRDR